MNKLACGLGHGLLHSASSFGLSLATSMEEGGTDTGRCPQRYQGPKGPERVKKPIKQRKDSNSVLYPPPTMNLTCFWKVPSNGSLCVPRKSIGLPLSVKKQGLGDGSLTSVTVTNSLSKSTQRGKGLFGSWSQGSQSPVSCCSCL